MAKPRIPVENVKEILVTLKNANDLHERAIQDLERIVNDAERRKTPWVSFKDLKEIIKAYIKYQYDADFPDLEIPDDW